MPVTGVDLVKLAVKRLPAPRRYVGTAADKSPRFSKHVFLYLSLSSGNLSRKIEVSNGKTLIER